MWGKEREREPGGKDSRNTRVDSVTDGCGVAREREGGKECHICTYALVLPRVQLPLPRGFLMSQV